MKHVRREFRQLAHAGQGRSVHDKGRQNFRITVRGMRIEKEGGQTALHARTEAAIERETSAGNLGGALEIQNPRAFRNFPMGPRLKIKLWRRPPSAHLDISAGVMP